MKAPVARPSAVRIIVQPAEDHVASAVASERLSDAEAWQIAKAIKPRFAARILSPTHRPQGTGAARTALLRSCCCRGAILLKLLKGLTRKP